MQKRKTMDKIPIQANFYPLPSMAFLQDKSSRLTLLSAQSNGVAGLHQGNVVYIVLTVVSGCLLVASIAVLCSETRYVQDRTLLRNSRKLRKFVIIVIFVIFTVLVEPLSSQATL